MREKEYREEGRPEDLLKELGYETQDIKYKQFSVYGAFFFGFFIFCIVAGFGIMWLMSPTKLHGGRMADYKPKTDMPLAAPLLQSNITARTDIMSLRRNETKELTTPGVIDQSHGVYRIPIDQAIDDVANESDSDKTAMGLPSVRASGAESTGTAAQPLISSTTVDDHVAVKRISAKSPSNVNRGESTKKTPQSGGKGG